MARRLEVHSVRRLAVHRTGRMAVFLVIMSTIVTRTTGEEKIDLYDLFAKGNRLYVHIINSMDFILYYFQIRKQSIESILHDIKYNK